MPQNVDLVDFGDSCDLFGSLDQFTNAWTMPVCYQCNGSGKCRNCSCSRLGKNWVDCLPSKRQHCMNTRGHHDHASPDNTTVVTDPQAQQALNGDGEESRQGRTAKDVVGNVKNDTEAKSHQQVKEWVSQPCLPLPLYVPWLCLLVGQPRWAHNVWQGHCLLQSSHPLEEKCFQDPVREGREGLCERELLSPEDRHASKLGDDKLQDNQLFNILLWT